MFAPQAGLDEYHRQMEQDVSEMVNRTRGEGVSRMMKLKRKFGCTKDDDDLLRTQSKVRRDVEQEEVWKKTRFNIMSSVF